MIEVVVGIDQVADGLMGMPAWCFRDDGAGERVILGESSLRVTHHRDEIANSTATLLCVLPDMSQTLFASFSALTAAQAPARFVCFPEPPRLAFGTFTWRR